MSPHFAHEQAALQRETLSTGQLPGTIMAAIEFR